MALKILKRKKGQAIFFGIMVAIMVFVTLVLMIPTIKGFITTARDSDHLNCTSTAISTGSAVSCILTDWYMPYFIAAGIAIAIKMISGKEAVNIIQ